MIIVCQNDCHEKCCQNSKASSVLLALLALVSLFILYLCSHRSRESRPLCLSLKPSSSVPLKTNEGANPSVLAAVSKNT